MTLNDLVTGDVAVIKQDDGFSVRKKQPKGNSLQIRFFNRKKTALKYALKNALGCKAFQASNNGNLHPII